jgi:thiol-disulfide isomerase/thioredoxin
VPKRIKQGIVAVILLLISLLGLSYFYFQENSPTAAVRVGDVIDFSAVEVENESGRNVPLIEAIAKNGGTLMSFWATWCEPCLREIPKILGSEISRNAKILWINLDYGSSLDRVKAVKAWKAENKIDLETVFDGKGQLGELLQINGLPLNLLVSHDGKILWSKMGLLSAGEIKELAEKTAGL